MPTPARLAVAVVSFAAFAAFAEPSVGSGSQRHASAVQALDETLSAKCHAFTHSDCSGKVKPARAPLFNALKGKSEKLELPKDARRDATAGVFI